MQESTEKKQYAENNKLHAFISAVPPLALDFLSLSVEADVSMFTIPHCFATTLHEKGNVLLIL